MCADRALWLRYKMAKGQVYRYAIRVTKRNGPDETVLRMQMVQTVTAVSADGSFSIDMALEPQTYAKNGKESAVSQMARQIQMRMTPFGQIIESNPPGFEAMQASFPQRELSMGEGWEEVRPVPLPEEPDGTTPPPAQVRFQYTLDGVDNVGGYHCARIRCEQTPTDIALGAGRKQRMSASGTTCFAHQEGRLVQSRAETISTIEWPQGAVRQSTEITIDLQSPAPPAATPSLGFGGDEYLIAP